MIPRVQKPWFSCSHEKPWPWYPHEHEKVARQGGLRMIVGAEHPVDVRLARTEAERRLARAQRAKQFAGIKSRAHQGGLWSKLNEQTKE